MKIFYRLHAAVLVCGVLLAALGAGVAHASPPIERIVCTTLPGQAWLGEEKIKALFGVQDYLQVDFKISNTQCYEFYAIKKNGEVVEAYYHPVTGQLVRRNLLPRVRDTKAVPPANATVAPR